jgi:Protein of unknown function (DUF3108)
MTNRNTIHTVLARMLLSTLVLGFTVRPFSAQDHDERPSEPAKPKIVSPLPFKAGETLDYEVSFSKFIFGGKIGNIKLSTSRTNQDKTELIQFTAEATSKGFFPALFGLKVKDRFNATVYADDFGLHTANRKIEEGKSKKEQRTTINRETGRVTYVDRNLGRNAPEPTVKEAPSPVWVQDVLSAIYFMRTQSLTPGAEIPIPISDVGKTYDVEVVVGQKEELSLQKRKLKTIIVDAKIFDGRFIRKSGELLVWVTDDARHIPVKARLKVSGFTVFIELKKPPRD